MKYSSNRKYRDRVTIVDTTQQEVVELLEETMLQEAPKKRSLWESFKTKVYSSKNLFKS